MEVGHEIIERELRDGSAGPSKPGGQKTRPSESPLREGVTAGETARDLAAGSGAPTAVDDARPTLVLDGGVEDETGLLTGTIRAHGRPMRVFVPADSVDALLAGDCVSSASQARLASFEADVARAEAAFAVDDVGPEFQQAFLSAVAAGVGLGPRDVDLLDD